MVEEIEGLAQHMQLIADYNWTDFSIREGVLFGRRVLLVQSGIGKIITAMVSQYLIDTFNPVAMLLTGVAGALNPELEIGDVVICRDCVQHDMDAQALGYSRGTIPFTSYRFFQANIGLSELALSAPLQDHQIILGRILTGDQFLTKKEITHYEYLIQDLKGDCIEMEGAANALVCTLNNIPFLIVRTISDRADGSAAADFNTFLPVVASNSIQIIRTILESDKLNEIIDCNGENH